MVVDEVRALALSGMLGAGYLESTLKIALSWEPTFIGCDAGSTDSGASSLGMGKCSFSRAAVKRDLRLGLLAARNKNIPMIVGSAGSAGAEPNLSWLLDIVREVAREEDLHFTLGIIHSEQNKEYLKQKMREGKVKPLKPVLPYDEVTIDRSSHIVGMMGAEPIIRALEAGAEVVIGGRSSDTSIYAAIPMQRGFDPGPTWHAAKVLECGAASVTHRKFPDCMFARIRKHDFIVKPPTPEYVCTPLSVAAHTLYETASPFHLYEPSGMVDTSDSVYEAETERSVRVSGTKFVPAQTYTIKLEGAEFVGYQSFALGGMRDPVMIRQIDSWIATFKEKMHSRLVQMFGEDAEGKCIFNIRIYGKNGVMGKLEPIKETQSHELLLIMEGTAPTQEMATAIASSARHMGLHLPVPEWKGLISGLAFPYTPAHVERGPLYKFNVNHVVEPADPYEMFPMEIEKV